jgi:rhamnosyltransferase
MKFNYCSHVLICVHNGEKYIYSQIESLINQTMPVDYIHIYDFNSLDSSLIEINRAQVNFKESSVVFDVISVQETPGVNKSFDFALKDLFKKIKPGDYIFLCDQDDVWLAFKNKKIYSALKSKNNLDAPVLIHHDVNVVDDELRQLEESYYNNAQKKLICSEYKLNEYYGLAIGHTICMNYFAAKTLSAIDYDDKIYMYDWFWSSLIEKLGKKYFLDIPLSKYRQHQSNIIGVNGYKDRNKKNLLKNFYYHTNSVAKQNLYINRFLRQAPGGRHLKFYTSVTHYKYLIFKVKNLKVLTLTLFIDFQILKNAFIEFFIYTKKK